MNLLISALVMSFVFLVLSTVSPPAKKEDFGSQIFSCFWAGVLAGLITYALLER
jgi:hypothetical protein